MPQTVEISLRIPSLRVRREDSDAMETINNSDVRFCKQIEVDSIPKPGAVLTMSVNGGVIRIEDEFITSDAVEIDSVLWSVVEPTREGGSLRLKDVTLQLEPAGEISVEAVDPSLHKLREFTRTLYRIAYRIRTQANVPQKTAITLSA